MKNFLCGKSQGLLTSCRDCENKCIYGKRALELAAVRPVTENVPYDQTILGKMRAEIASKQKDDQEPIRSTKRVTAPENQGWFLEAMKAANPYEWTAEYFNIPLKKAKKKIWQYRYAHKAELQEAGVKTEETKPEEKPVERRAYSDFEAKLDSLMKLQEEYKTKQEEYQKLADEYAEKWKEVNDKTDLLVRAMEILES